MSDAVITMTGDAKQLIAQYEAANKTIDKLTVKLSDAARAGRIQAQAEREGLAVTKQNATALEIYAAGLAKAERLLKAGTISQTTFNREVARLKGELSSTEAKLSNFLGMIAKLGGAAAAIKAVGGAVTGEIDLQRERERRAADESLSYGDVLRRTTANFGADQTVSLEQLDSEYAGIQGRQGVRDRKSVARVAANAFSAKGQRTNREALDIVEQAFRFAGGDEEIANTLAGRTLDISKQTGVTDGRAVLGFLSQAQKAARITDITQLGKQGVTAMLGATAHGATAEQSAELFATVNALLADEEGANSKTAMLNLTGQLMDEKKMTKAGLSKTFAGKGVMERLTMLQKDKKLADKFLGEASFEVAAAPFMEKLVRGDAAAMEILKASQDTVPMLGAASAKAFESNITAMDSAPQTRAANIGRQADANRQADELDKRQREALAGEADRIFEETIRKINLPGFDESPIWGVPGQREIMKRNVDINRTLKGRGGVGSVKATMEMMAQGGTFSELGGTLSEADTAFLLKQLIEINKLQLEEQKLDREQAKKNAAPPAPPAPGQPLVGGGNPALAGAPQ